MDRNELNPPPPPKRKKQVEVVTVRMTPALHEALMEEKHVSRTSMNQICLDLLTEGLIKRAKKREKSDVD